jgi:hypothetical protein
VGTGANDVAKGGKQLQENGFGLRLSVRSQSAYGFSGEAIERVLLEYGIQGVLGRGRLLLGERRLWRRTRERAWVRGGRSGDWRRSRVRVSRTGCVLGGEVCLGKQLSTLLFYLCEGRWVEPGYAHPQVSY